MLARSYIIIIAIGTLFIFLGCSKLNGDAKGTVSNEQSIEADEAEDQQAVQKPIQKLSPVEYVKWIEDPANGLVKQKNIGDYSFTAFYTPPAYLAYKQLNSSEFTQSEFNKKLSDFGEMQYFSFKIESLKEQNELLKVGITSEEEYYSRLEYFSFKMQNDLKLIENGDTLHCSLFHFERSYGLAPYATFVMGFPKGGNSSKSLLYADKIFNVGNIFLRLRKQDLINLPIIQI